MADYCTHCGIGVQQNRPITLCPECMAKFGVVDHRPGRAIDKLVCLRCGASWFPRTPTPPKTCPAPACRSPYWNRPRRVKA